MPRGPNGERRPADTVGCAVTVARIATGEDEETAHKQPAKAKCGKAGGKARAETLTRARGRAIARQAAAARWEYPLNQFDPYRARSFTRSY